MCIFKNDVEWQRFYNTSQNDHLKEIKQTQKNNY